MIVRGVPCHCKAALRMVEVGISALDQNRSWTHIALALGRGLEKLKKHYKTTRSCWRIQIYFILSTKQKILIDWLIDWLTFRSSVLEYRSEWNFSPMSVPHFGNGMNFPFKCIQISYLLWTGPCLHKAHASNCEHFGGGSYSSSRCYILMCFIPISMIPST